MWHPAYESELREIEKALFVLVFIVEKMFFLCCNRRELRPPAPRLRQRHARGAQRHARTVYVYGLALRVGVRRPYSRSKFA